ncbi:RDD family protein [Streptacidiphilus sp. N1-3]|uniref:RDD family protein n=1 Tax=Streptacidiphilus alkalitolerans TaxID=3342712 RepID=A0ABV6XCI3_9ACTN
MPGEAAPWDARAYSSLVDIAVAAGIMTAWQLTLVAISPVLQIGAWLTGGNWNNLVSWSTYTLVFAWWGWQWLERGITGQSLGQRLMGVAVVDEETRRPIGPVRSLMRSLTHVVDVLPLWAGLARPAWDPKRQTWADKIHHTTAITVARPPQVPRQE